MTELFPEILNYYEIMFLIISCFLGALLSTTMGTGGGLIVIGVMAMVLPITTLLSIHGIVQFGSGFLRGYLFRKEVLRKFFLIFVFGTIIGYILSINVLVTLPQNILKLILGLGIICLVLIPKFKFENITTKKIVILGIVTGFLSMFIGVTAPLIAIFISSFIKDRMVLVGTLAWCVSFQHFGKVLIFGSLGFDYTPWITLILLLIFSSYIGTIIGKKLLLKTNDVLFKKILKYIILFLGLKLVLESLGVFNFLFS